MEVVGPSPLCPKGMGVLAFVSAQQRVGQVVPLSARCPPSPVVEVLGLGNWDPRPFDGALFQLRTLRSRPFGLVLYMTGIQEFPNLSCC